LFEGRGNIASIKRPYHWEVVPSNVGYRGFGKERISNLQHSMLLHLIP
jgi:hypothetical protein